MAQELVHAGNPGSKHNEIASCNEMRSPKGVEVCDCVMLASHATVVSCLVHHMHCSGLQVSQSMLGITAYLHSDFVKDLGAL